MKILRNALKHIRSVPKSTPLFHTFLRNMTKNGTKKNFAFSLIYNYLQNIYRFGTAGVGLADNGDLGCSRPTGGNGMTNKDCGGHKKKRNMSVSPLVPGTGLEPAHLSIHAPETCASTNSAIRASGSIPTLGIWGSFQNCAQDKT